MPQLIPFYFINEVTTAVILFTVLISTFLILKAFRMPGIKCPACVRGIKEPLILPGKYCPRCGTACRH